MLKNSALLDFFACTNFHLQFFKILTVIRQVGAWLSLDLDLHAATLGSLIFLQRILYLDIVAVEE